MKIRPVGTELTDSLDKVNRWLRKFGGLKPNQLMLHREIIAVCSEIHTKHINTVCGQNVELLNVKLVVHTVTAGL